MTDLPFLIGTGIALSGLIIAYSTYKKSFPEKPKEEVEREDDMTVLLVYFRSTQRLGKDVRDAIDNYATSKGLLDAEMIPGISYRIYLQTMTDSHKHCLSDELYNKIASETYTKPQIKMLKDDLEIQFNALSEVKNHFLILNANL